MANQLDRWVSSRALNPFRTISQMQEPFDRLFNEFLNLRAPNGEQDLISAPDCEITDEGSSYLVKADLPGVTKDQVRVEADRDQLTIHAERKEEKKTDTKKKFLSEMYYGSYMRRFTLPGPIDEKKIEAKFENGVLSITVPKTELLKAKQIPIH